MSSHIDQCLANSLGNNAYSFILPSTTVTDLWLEFKITNLTAVVLGDSSGYSKFTEAPLKQKLVQYGVNGIAENPDGYYCYLKRWAFAHLIKKMIIKKNDVVVSELTTAGLIMSMCNNNESFFQSVTQTNSDVDCGCKEPIIFCKDFVDLDRIPNQRPIDINLKMRIPLSRGLFEYSYLVGGEFSIHIYLQDVKNMITGTKFTMLGDYSQALNSTSGVGCVTFEQRDVVIHHKKCVGGTPRLTYQFINSVPLEINNYFAIEKTAKITQNQIGFEFAHLKGNPVITKIMIAGKNNIQFEIAQWEAFTRQVTAIKGVGGICLTLNPFKFLEKCERFMGYPNYFDKENDVGDSCILYGNPKSQVISIPHGIIGPNGKMVGHKDQDLTNGYRIQLTFTDEFMCLMSPKYDYTACVVIVYENNTT